MGTGALTINGVTVTSLVDQESFEAKFQANQINSTSKAVLLDESRNTGGTPISIREQDDYILTDGGTRIFGGRVARCQPQVQGKSVVWSVDAVGYDVLLDERVIASAAVRTGSRTVAAEVSWIAAFHEELDGTTFVTGTETVDLDIDYSRAKSLRLALQLVQQIVPGYVFWVDEYKRLHWTRPEGAQMVVNPGFDGGASTGWTIGSQTLVVNGAGPGGSGDYALQSNTPGTANTQTATGLTVGRRYMFFLDMYSSVAAQARVTLTWQSPALSTMRTDTLTNVGTGWNRYKAVYTCPASADRVLISVNGVPAFTGTVAFDNIQLLGETASFGISTSPNGSSTFAPMGWSEDRQAIFPVNRLYVVGDGIAEWRESAASIAYFRGRKFEGIYEDAKVTDAAAIDAVAAEVFRRGAFPTRTGKYFTTRTGLVPGSWQIIEHGTLGIQTIDWIATITTKFDGNGYMLYEVDYGNPEDSIGSALASIGQVVAGGMAPPVGYSNPLLSGRDGTAPSAPVISAVTSAVEGSDAVLTVTVTQPGNLDLWATWVEVTGTYTGTQGAETPDWTTGVLAIPVGVDQTKAVFTGLRPSSLYWVRARSEDTSANASGDVYWGSNPHTTPGDSVAPGEVSSLYAVGVASGLIVSFAPPSDSDLATVDLEYAPDVAGSPGQWESGGTHTATVVSLLGLVAEKAYWVRARAVDTSANEGAWTTLAAAVTTGAIGSADFGANKITAVQIDTSTLSADMLESGTFTARPGLATDGGKAQGFKVMPKVGAGPTPPDPAAVGSWDANGLIIRDPSFPSTRYAVLNGGSLKITANGGQSWAVEMTPDGFRGESIRLGALPGGHNVCMNSGFELAPSVSSTTWAWTDYNGWTTTSVSNDNVSVGANDLTASIAY